MSKREKDIGVRRGDRRERIVYVHVQQGPTTYCTTTTTVSTRSYDRVKQLALNLHMQPREFTLGESLTIMRFYGVSFEGAGTDSSRLRDFSHNAQEKVGVEGSGSERKSIVAMRIHPLCIIQPGWNVYESVDRLSEKISSRSIRIPNEANASVRVCMYVCYRGSSICGDGESSLQLSHGRGSVRGIGNSHRKFLR